jgi:hypothetical protein
MASGSTHRRVQCHGGANERLERLFINLVPVMEIDGPGAPGLPSRLELKRPEGSSNEAPLANVIFTTFLYVSPVQIIPACDHTGVPGFVGFRPARPRTTVPMRVHRERGLPTLGGLTFSVSPTESRP